MKYPTLSPDLSPPDSEGLIPTPADPAPAPTIQPLSVPSVEDYTWPPGNYE